MTMIGQLTPASRMRSANSSPFISGIMISSIKTEGGLARMHDSATWGELKARALYPGKLLKYISTTSAKVLSSSTIYTGILIVVSFLW